MSSELLPCPLCGGPGVTNDHGSYVWCAGYRDGSVCSMGYTLLHIWQALPRPNEDAEALADDLEQFAHRAYDVDICVNDRILDWAARVRKLCAPDYASDPAVQDAREWIAAMNVVKAERDSALAEVERLKALLEEAEDTEVDFCSFDELLPSGVHVHPGGETDDMSLTERIEWVVADNERLKLTEDELLGISRSVKSLQWIGASYLANLLRAIVKRLGGAK